MKKIQWKTHVIELMVVIIGISVAFQLNNWKENSKTKSAEKLYLATIVNDLEADMQSLDSLIVLEENRLKNVLLLQTLLAKPDAPEDSIQILLGELGSIALFYSQNITYESMKFSGKLDLIGSLSLKNQMVALYEFENKGLIESEKYFRMVVDDYLLPMFLAELSNEGKVTSAIADKKFKSYLTSYIISLRQKIYNYKNFRQKSEQLKQAIELETN